MESYLDLMRIAQDTVLRPDFASAVVIFWFSLVNELAALLPYVALISGQVVFLNDHLTSSILYKLFLFVALPAGFGGALGSLLLYALAYIGGKPAIEKFGKYLRVRWESVENVSRRFKGAWYDELAFFALRCVPVLPSLPINLAAGILRMHPASYFLLTFVAFTIRMMIMFVFIGAGVEALSY